MVMHPERELTTSIDQRTNLVRCHVRADGRAAPDRLQRWKEDLRNTTAKRPWTAITSMPEVRGFCLPFSYMKNEIKQSVEPVAAQKFVSRILFVLYLTSPTNPRTPV